MCFCARSMLLLASMLLPLPSIAQSHRSDAFAHDSPEDAARPRYSFSLLPKAFQRHPLLDFNIITEMSIEGRNRPAPAPENPIHYITQSGGYLRMGPGASGSEKPPPIDILEKALRQALVAAGYSAADEGDPAPELVVIFHWGSYTVPTLDDEDVLQELAASTNPDAPPPRTILTASEQLPRVLADVARRKDVIERAALVGGLKFADDLAKALNEEATFANQQQNSSRVNNLLASGGGNVIGGSIMGSMPGFGSIFSPFERFRTQSGATSTSSRRHSATSTSSSRRRTTTTRSLKVNLCCSGAPG